MEKEINILRWLFISVGIIIVTIATVFYLQSNQVNYDNLTEVQIRIMGTMIPTGNEYTLILKNGTWFASHNRIEWFDNNIDETIVDDAFVSNIKEILKKNKAHKWDKFNIKYEIEKKLQTIATDGVYYSFYMYFSDGSVTQIKEYNIYPETFMTVYKAFEKEVKNYLVNN